MVGKSYSRLPVSSNQYGCPPPPTERFLKMDLCILKHAAATRLADRLTDVAIKVAGDCIVFVWMSSDGKFLIVLGHFFHRVLVSHKIPIMTGEKKQNHLLDFLLPDVEKAQDDRGFKKSSFCTLPNPLTVHASSEHSYASPVFSAVVMETAARSGGGSLYLEVLGFFKKMIPPSLYNNLGKCVLKRRQFWTSRWLPFKERGWEWMNERKGGGGEWGRVIILSHGIFVPA